MLVYKVVIIHKGPEGQREFFSCRTTSPTFRRKYEVGIPTTPLADFPRAKLFAFKDIHSAERFRTYGETIFVAEAQIARCQRIFISRDRVTSAIRRFWWGRPHKLDLSNIPEGTVFCNSITLLKEII